MLILGAAYLKSLVSQPGGFSAKMVFNANGAITFPVSEAHRDQKAAGISYADDYAGNALAAVLARGKIEVRYHRDFTDSQVAAIIVALCSQPELSFMRDWRVTYQGRVLSVSS
jgi:hypothetical protein